MSNLLGTVIEGERTLPQFDSKELAQHEGHRVAIRVFNDGAVCLECDDCEHTLIESWD